jgi:WD40 repeat protein
VYPFVTFSPDGRYLYEGGGDSKFYLYDIKTDEEIIVATPKEIADKSSEEDVDPGMAAFHPRSQLRRVEPHQVGATPIPLHFKMMAC